MKIVQSLWTGTPMFRASRDLFLVHTLSVCLLRRSFRQVELVTDDEGLAISELLGWEYTNVVNRLDELTATGPRFLWALGKMFSLLLQDHECAHIDNDALVFGPLPSRAMSSRLLAERVDNPWHYRSADALKARTHLGLPPGATAYNCGIIGGTDVHLLHQYAARSMELAATLRESGLNGTVCSMAFEQYWLGVFAREKGVRVETVLPAQATLSQARRAKYLHLTGPIKRQAAVVAQVEARLRRDFPQAYRSFREGWPRVERGEFRQLFVVKPYL